MGVPARTNAEGRNVFFEDFDVKYSRFSSDGTSDVRHDLVRLPVHLCDRFKGPSSPPRQIPGTSTMWRDPKDYERSVCEIDFQEGKWNKVTSTSTEDASGPEANPVWQWHFSPTAFDLPSVVWSGELESEAIAQATQRIKDRKVSLGENLAEARKTYRTLMSESLNLLRALRSVKRGNIALAVKHLKDGRSVERRGADLYLQYKYGWKPLMQDIYGSAELLQEQVKTAFIISGYGKSASDQVQAISSDGVTRSGYGYRQCRVKLFGLLDDYTLRLGDRLGISNPLSLAWDLIPYSFVVDWFIPVGNVLEAMQPPAGVKFLGGCATTKGEIQFSCTSNPHPSMSMLVEPRKSHKLHSVRRRAYGSWPKPGLYTVNPFKDSNGLSAIALLLQQLRR